MREAGSCHSPFNVRELWIYVEDVSIQMSLQKEAQSSSFPRRRGVFACPNIRSWYVALSSIFRSKVVQESPRGSSIPLEEGRVLFFAYTSDSMLPLTLTGCPYFLLKKPCLFLNVSCVSHPWSPSCQRTLEQPECVHFCSITSTVCSVWVAFPSLLDFLGIAL